jgi:ATP-dependent Clp protease adaptor protein ClpS
MSDNDKRGGGTTEGPNTGVVVKARPKTRKPAMYKVLMLNDDYTPMEFVVHVLERFFQKNREEATRIMLHVHRRGVGVCGVYTYEVAETKVTQVMDLARQNQHPLQCTIEKELCRCSVLYRQYGNANIGCLTGEAVTSPGNDQVPDRTASV